MEKEKYTYDRKERLKLRKERYLKILEWIKDEPLSRKEIANRLRLKEWRIFESSLIKDYLNKMVSKREIGSLDKSFEHKDYKWIFEQAYGKKWDIKKNIYYLYTPRSKALYDELNELISNTSNKDKCQGIIDSISNFFRVLEIISNFEKERFFNDKIVKWVLKEKNIEPSKDNIKKEKNHVLNTIMNFSNKEIKIGLSFSKVETINNKKYFVVGNKGVQIEKIYPYLGIPRKKMSHIMLWISHHRDVNGELIARFFLKRMTEIAFEIEKIDINS